MIDHAFLSENASKLDEGRTAEITSALEKPGQRFPYDPMLANATGRCLLLRPETHRAFFEQLKSTGVASFILSPPTKDTTEQENPFFDDAHVRITRVRPWVLGIETRTGPCIVHVRNEGPELIMKADRTVVPVIHNPVEISFRYDWTRLEWNSRKHYVENPQAALMHDGGGGDSRPADDIKGSSYVPLIGPFARWRIQLVDDGDMGLDRSRITAVCMEFHGVCETFDPVP